jgi:DNA-binding CsgD family transcriptional regulator
MDTTEVRFTSRQRQVVELIAAGCSNVEIGRRLGVSARTAKAHCDVLRRKLGVLRRRQIPAAYRLVTGEDPLPALEELGDVVPSLTAGGVWGERLAVSLGDALQAGLRRR